MGHIRFDINSKTKEDERLQTKGKRLHASMPSTNPNNTLVILD